MDENYVKQLKEIIREEVTQIVDKSIDTALKPIKKTLDEHTEKIDALTADMTTVQGQIGGVSDKMKLYYENNKRDINEIRKELHMPTSPLLTEQSEFSH